MEPDDNDMPELSGSALAALKEFYVEKDVHDKRFGDLKSAVEQNTHLSMEMFSEDWNASQFWYSDETASQLARQLLEGATDETAIAVISAPSAFIQIKNLLPSKSYSISPRLSLLEYDSRFSVLEEFVHYDFNSPFNLPSNMKGQYDRIICDPPFLSEECQTKAALTARWLLRATSTGESQTNKHRIIICTGERMGSLICRLYPNTKTTTFDPKHTKGLSNEFRCYANFECDAWTWR